VAGRRVASLAVLSRAIPARFAALVLAYARGLAFLGLLALRG
jgi:hypothetical protein